MIDIHSHILPGIDDGAKDIDEALQMARIAVADGIRMIVATPHLFKPSAAGGELYNTKKCLLEQVRLFQERLISEDIALKILPGSEIPLRSESIRLLQEGLLLGLNDGACLLLELPHFFVPSVLEEICFQVQSKGFTMIIAHPERHPMILEKPERLERLIDLGCLAQLTAASLTGWFGSHVATVSRFLVKKGYVHFLASDAHSMKGRSPVLSKAVTALSKLIGHEAASRMVTETPEHLLRG